MTNRKIYPNRIKEIRKSKGLTLEDLADHMSGDRPAAATINRWELGSRDIGPKNLERVAKALGVSVTSLFNEQGIAPRRLIPILGSVPGGNWREAIEDVRGEMGIDADLSGDFALDVIGDSMDKIAPEGSRVVVAADDVDLHERKVYVVTNSEGEATFKRYMSSPARLEPVSSNSEHQPIRIGHDAFRVIGRVTEVRITP